MVRVRNDKRILYIDVLLMNEKSIIVLFHSPLNRRPKRWYKHNDFLFYIYIYVNSRTLKLRHQYFFKEFVVFFNFRKLKWFKIYCYQNSSIRTHDEKNRFQQSPFCIMPQDWYSWDVMCPINWMSSSTLAWILLSAKTLTRPLYSDLLLFKLDTFIFWLIIYIGIRHKKRRQ